MCITSLIMFLFISLSCQPEKEKSYVVGIINPSGGLEDVVTGFKKGMEKHGYTEGKNITYLYDGPLDGIEPVDAKIREMLDGHADLIYSLTTPATKKLKEALAGTPVPGVFGPVFDPVSSGVIDSLARPGGQMTGVKVRGSSPKALEWLVAIVPGVKRIFIPFHITDKAACQTVDDLQQTASKLNIELVTEDLTSEGELEKVLTKIPDDADALWLTCSHLLMSNVQKIVAAADARNIPTVSSTHSRRRSGILVSYGENDMQLGEQVSRLADKVLKGTAPGNIPVESAEYILVIDLKAARNLNIEVPDAVLKQADIIDR